VDDASDASAMTEGESYDTAATAPSAWKRTRGRVFGGYPAAHVRKSRQAAPAPQTLRGRGRW